MATVNLKAFYVKPFTMVKGDILRTIKNGAQTRNITVNVTKGSDYDILAEAVANEVVAASNNTVIKADKQMVDSATGVDLDRIGAIVGVPRRPAGGSIGNIVTKIAATTSVATGAQLTDATALRYQVVNGGPLTLVGSPPGSVSIVIQAILDPGQSGAATNHPQGDVLTWASPPPFTDPRVAVDIGGLQFGTDIELDDPYRARILTRLRNPPAGGNAAQIATWAEGASPAVQKAFIYPALDGPATVSVAIAAALVYSPSVNAGAGGLTRTIIPAIANVVGGIVVGNMPEYANLKLLSVADSAADVSIRLTLPAAVTASPPGLGGGWTDASPWPSLTSNGSTTASRVSVSGTPASSTTFVLTSNDAANVPDPAGITDGITNISWFDPVNIVWRTSTILSHSGTTGNVTVTIDQQNPFSGIATGHFVGPAASRVNTYGQAFLAAMGAMGPGEATSDANRLPRAARHPFQAQSWPASLTALQTKAVQDAGPEVLDVQYAYRSLSSPAVPADTNTAVNILVPRNIGFYVL